MCGIVGVFGHHPVSQVLYESLSMLQHRGQDAAGIATCFEDRFYLEKGNGLITEVFNANNMARLLGDMGIGHVRYPTAGCASVAEAQPFYVNSPYGIVFAGHHRGPVPYGHAASEYHFGFRGDAERLCPCVDAARCGEPE